MEYHKPLTPMAVLTRENEAQKEREKLNRKMRNKQLETSYNQFHQSTSAINDTHMRDALAKVRENSDITIPNSLARIHGTTIYNKPDKGR
tara:strand:+ start:528 stop:797 length:270 start_codon:yes stop_codon:yes gene_type:complete